MESEIGMRQVAGGEGVKFLKLEAMENEIHRRDAEISAELMPRRRRGGMGWETREQTCPHEWGHGSLEGCSTVWVT